MATTTANNALFTNNAAAALSFKNRIADSLLRVKQELGIDELLLSIHDAKKLASPKVEDYLSEYSDEVKKAILKADTAVSQSDYASDGNLPLRTGKMIEKLVGMTWKNTYEIAMEDINSKFPLAQQIVTKYMSNFSVRPKMS